MQPIISVIVPVYNVEKYVEECINSLRKQMYDALEIILVDDGSTDQSGKICDAYAEIDQRIHVLHKENGGLSDARNAGLELSTGDYIGFIDSDDLIDRNYYEILMKQLIENQCDIAVAKIREFADSGKILHELGFENTTVLQTREAVKELLYSQNIANSACNKLFKRKVLAKYRFPYGKYYEDEYTVYKWFLNAKKVCISGENSFYWYRKRAGSITQKPFSDREMDRIYASEEKVAFFSTYDKEMGRLARRYLVYDCISVIVKRVQLKNSAYEKYAVKHIRNNIWVYLRGNNSRISKLFALMCCVNVSLAKRIYYFITEVLEYESNDCSE